MWYFLLHSIDSAHNKNVIKTIVTELDGKYPSDQIKSECLYTELILLFALIIST